MKTLFKNISIVLIILTLGTSSCSKSDDSPPPPTTAELLAHKWFIVKSEDSSTSPPTVEIADACRKKGYYNFLSGGTINFETFYLNINNMCVSKGISSGTYALSQNGQQIYLTNGSPSMTQVLPIDILNESELVCFVSPTARIFFERQP